MMAILQITICYANFLEKDGPITRKERKSYLSWAYRLLVITMDHSMVMIDWNNKVTSLI